MKRRTKRQIETLVLVAVIVAGIGFIAWLYRGAPESRTASMQPSQAARPMPPGPSPAPPGATPGRANAIVAAVASEGPEPPATPVRADPQHQGKAQELYRKGMDSYDKKKWLDARKTLNEALAIGLGPASEADARRKLEDIADKTLFSASAYPNTGDSVLIWHSIEPRQTLVHLEKLYLAPLMIVQRINEGLDPRRLQPNQRIKVIQGPFHATVDKSDFRLDLYVQDLYVKSFTVGLGEDDSTPTGTWIVGDGKAIKPPFDHPRTKKHLTAEDPEYPLGTRWIPLVGVSGEAAGSSGYGIHGTNEPDSIGKMASLGCIRMLNKDVEFVYDCLLVRHSKVFVRD